MDWKYTNWDDPHCGSPPADDLCKDLIRSTSRSFETKHHQELHATRKRPLETVLPPKTMVAVDLGFPKRSRRVGDRSKVSNLPPRTRVIWDDSQTTAKCWMCEKHELFLERFLQSSYTSQLPYPAKLLPRAKVVIQNSQQCKLAKLPIIVALLADILDSGFLEFLESLVF